MTEQQLPNSFFWFWFRGCGVEVCGCPMTWPFDYTTVCTTLQAVIQFVVNLSLSIITVYLSKDYRLLPKINIK